MVVAAIFLGMLLSLRAFAQQRRVAGGVWFLLSLIGAVIQLNHHITDALSINL